jgi:prepilin signal peptidase PulO-like enzyme (type II secretory pathway)
MSGAARYLIMVTAFVAVPCLTVLAYRGWAKNSRQDLPRWRSVLGITSISVTFLNWFGCTILALSALVDFNIPFSSDWVSPLALLVLLGTCLALALRGAPRLQAIVAGVLMVAVWLTSVVS